MNAPGSIRLTASAQLVEKYSLPLTTIYIIAITFQSTKSGYDTFIEGDNASFKIIRPYFLEKEDIDDIIDALNPVNIPTHSHAKTFANQWSNTIYRIISIGTEAEGNPATNLPLVSLFGGTKIIIESFGKLYSYTFPQAVDPSDTETLALFSGGSILFRQVE